MSLTTTQAVTRGIRRGIQIAINPNTDHLRDLSEQARSQDYLEQAWADVGQALRDSMSTQRDR